MSNNPSRHPFEGNRGKHTLWITCRHGNEIQLSILIQLRCPFDGRPYLLEIRVVLHIQLSGNWLLARVGCHSQTKDEPTPSEVAL